MISLSVQLINKYDNVMKYEKKKLIIMIVMTLLR